MKKEYFSMFLIALIIGIVLLNSISALDVFDCQDLNQPNTVYNLKNNLLNVQTNWVVYQGTYVSACFVISAQNVTFDGGGYLFSGKFNSTNGITTTGIAVFISDGALIKNFKIKNFSNAIQIMSSNNTVITKNNFSENYVGVTMIHITGININTNISENSFINNYHSGVSDTNSLKGLGSYYYNNYFEKDVYGIFFSTKNTIVLNNKFINMSQHGVYPYQAVNFTIKDNLFLNSKDTAVKVDECASSNSIILNNNFTGDSIGIMGIEGSSNITIYNNIMMNFNLSQTSNPNCLNPTGIFLHLNTSNFNITNNLIANYYYGIGTNQTNNSVIYKNTLFGNNISIALSSSSFNNLISNNVITYDSNIVGNMPIYPASPTNGNQYISNTIYASTYHPADTSKNLSIEAQELLIYKSYFKTATPWTDGSGFIPSNYATNAVVLFKFGPKYYYNSSLTCPGCWLPQ